MACAFVFYLSIAIILTLPCLVVKVMRQVHEGEPTWITTIVLTAELLVLFIGFFYLFFLM